MRAFMIGTALSLSTAVAVAQAPAPSARQAPRQETTQQRPFERVDTFDMRMGTDGLVTYVLRYRGRINDAAMVQPAGTFTFPVNEHFFTIELVEAFTRKADGRIVRVAPERVLVQRAPASSDALIFQVDITTRTVVFSDIAPGDEVEAAFRVTQKRPHTPGGTAWRIAFPRAAPYASAEFRLTVPTSLPVFLSQDGLDHTRSDNGGETTHVWIYRGRPRANQEAGAIHPYDFEPSLSFSTYPTWEAVGTAVGEGFERAARPTPEITALARQLAEGLQDDRAKANAILSWITSHVRYAAIVIGAGGFVPRDAATIFADRFGDCKDMVTLMRVMLDAIGVRSEYALVNAAAVYREHPLPVPLFDHVILYLPTLDLYVDPTVSTGRLGELPYALWEKPVLRFGPRGVSTARIPALKPEDNSWTLTADMTVAEDGTVTGTSVAIARGAAAIWARSQGQAIVREGSQAAATRLLRAQQNWQGSGEIEVTDARDAPGAEVRTRFRIENSVLPGADSQQWSLIPTGPRVNDRPFLNLRNAMNTPRTQPFLCFPYRYEEHLTIRWPPGFSLDGTPFENDRHGGGASIKTNYAAVGDTGMRVTRAHVWNPPSAVCDPSVAQSALETLNAAFRDLNARLRLRRVPAP